LSFDAQVEGNTIKRNRFLLIIFVFAALYPLYLPFFHCAIRDRRGARRPVNAKRSQPSLDPALRTVNALRSQHALDPFLACGA
jgi:hypothetical protein